MSFAADLIYLDNAATSWPKPPAVAAEVSRFLTDIGASPGRSAHRLSISAGRVLDDAREAIADLFSGDPLRTVLTCNVTEALNLALFGLLEPGDRCVTTAMDHNSVLRPLHHLAAGGVTVDILPADSEGRVDPAELEEAVSGARLVAISHASNVTGTIQDVRTMARICHRAGALLLVDAAQTAGHIPLSVPELDIDLLAFTGHKALLGPTGTGGLIIGDRVDPVQIRPFKFGGTGSRSASTSHPEFLPDRFEAGTPNAAGFAGLTAGIRYLLDRTVADVRRHELELTQLLDGGLRDIPGVAVQGPADVRDRTGVVSFTIAGRSPSDVAMALDDRYGILVRAGLHCAPLAHRAIGTFPRGTVRASFGPFVTAGDIERTVTAVGTIAGEVE